MKRLVFITVLSVIAAGSCFSQVSNTNVSGDVTLVIKSNMYVDSFIYPFTFKGITSLMDDLILDSPEVYDKLQPAYEKLLKKDKKTKTVGVGLLIGSGALAATGITLLIIGDSEFKQAEPGEGDSAMTMIGIGGVSSVLSLAGITFGIVGASGGFGIPDDELMDFVNKHNRVNPDHLITVR